MFHGCTYAVFKIYDADGVYLETINIKVSRRTVASFQDIKRQYTNPITKRRTETYLGNYIDETLTVAASHFSGSFTEYQYRQTQADKESYAHKAQRIRNYYSGGYTIRYWPNSELLTLYPEFAGYDVGIELTHNFMSNKIDIFDMHVYGLPLETSPDLLTEGIVFDIPDPPEISEPIWNTDTSVTGTGTEGAYIILLNDTDLVGLGTATVSGGVWSIGVLPQTPGDVLSATQTIYGQTSAPDTATVGDSSAYDYDASDYDSADYNAS